MVRLFSLSFLKKEMKYVAKSHSFIEINDDEEAILLEEEDRSTNV